MDPFKQKIQRQLVASILSDKCLNSERVIFRTAWCTQERVLRFTTSFFRACFSIAPGETGKWKTGDCVMYEVNNDPDSLVVRCMLDLASVPAEKSDTANRLIRLCGRQGAGKDAELILKSWDLTQPGGDINRMLGAFDLLLNRDVPLFEQELKDGLAATDQSAETYREGEAASAEVNRYERNPKARAACLAYHGTACAVCGMDFGKAFGLDFAGMIEVHHVVPISMIGKSYVVDPVHDLIPVCPNCHAALHSKKDGVYTVSELKAIRKEQRE